MLKLGHLSNSFFKSLLNVEVPSLFKCIQALLKLTNKKCPPKPRYAIFGKLQDPETEDVIDHALTLWFPGRHYCIIPKY